MFFEIQCKDGLDMVVEETKNFDRIIRGVYEITARDIYGSSETPGLAAFAYGSPGRIELIGGDSDADIFLAERERTDQTTTFRSQFRQRLGNFDFSKVDLTGWGTYEDINTFLSKSLVEGNQILEMRYLCGDFRVQQEVEEIKQRIESPERALKNIIFNRLYFNQYFRQRVRGASLNVKYCTGGSREFLFVYWNDRLGKMLSGEREDSAYTPRVKVGLRRLVEQGNLHEREYADCLDAVSFSMALRSDILRINKNTLDKGLTFLDEDTLLRLYALGYPEPEIVKRVFEKYRGTITRVVDGVWEQVTHTFGDLRGSHAAEQIRKAYQLETSQEVRASLDAEDPLIRVALIWGASESGQKNNFNALTQRHMQTEDWATIGSIVCSPLCSPEVLHHFGTGILKDHGYGYLLRVVARNKNVKKETLESIAMENSLEKRYTEVALAALNLGNVAANNQV